MRCFKHAAWDRVARPWCRFTTSSSLRARPPRLLSIVAARHGPARAVVQRPARIAGSVVRGPPEKPPSPTVARSDAEEARPIGTQTTTLAVCAGKTGSRYCSWRTRPVWSAGEDSRRFAGLGHGCDETRDGAMKRAILALESGSCCEESPQGRKISRIRQQVRPGENRTRLSLPETLSSRETSVRSRMLAMRHSLPQAMEETT